MELNGAVANFDLPKLNKGMLRINTELGAQLCLAILIVLAAASVPAGAAKGYITQLAAPFDCLHGVDQQPSAVLDNMQAMSEDGLTDTQLAQKYYCTSAALYMLTYPTRAAEEVNTALSYLSPESQPWLYHKTQLLHAEIATIAGESIRASELTNPVLTWAITAKDDEMKMYALRARGVAKTQLGDYLGALKDLNQAYSLASEVNSGARAAVGSALALVYEYREEYELAIPYFQQSVNYYRGNKNQLSLNVDLYGLGYAYSRLGQFSLGRETLQESLHIAQSINDDQGVAYAKKELGYINIEMGNYAVAKKLLAESEKLAKESDNPFLTMIVHLYQGDLFLALGDVDAATQANAQAESLINMSEMPVDYLLVQQQKAALSAAKGYYRDAYDVIRKVLEEKLSIMRKHSAEQLLQIRAQYELETKENENQLLLGINNIAEAELKTQRSRNVLLLLLLATVGIICVLLAYIIIRNQEVQRKLQQMANLDGLTGVPNRRRTMELIENQLGLARRHNYPLAVAIIDLDDFKAVNDNFGHPTGDKVLEAFGLVLTQNMRATDIIGRIGGEEFIVALPHTNTKTAFNVLEQLRMKTHKVPDLIDDYRFSVSFSCGLCNATHFKALSDLMATADSALYSAKQSGKDRIVVVDDCQTKNKNGSVVKELAEH
ncbi:tetratricopeptide repeat-containing diguanylate cyclase [Halioxenophilus aromaticivorans]|uniref:diguanylate cyclase n=1 Tax=Halioxenophilus aromaticivorans TaxID=1306992 RepID=A0AAV3TWU7_9ALTE